MALISSHRTEPALPIEEYRTEQTFSVHGGTPILDRRLAFPAHHRKTTIMRIEVEEMDSNPENFGAPLLSRIDYATSIEAKAEMLVEYDPDIHMLLGFWPGEHRSDVFVLTNVEHYLNELGYVTEESINLVDRAGRKWLKR